MEKPTHKIQIDTENSDRIVSSETPIGVLIAEKSFDPNYPGINIRLQGEDVNNMFAKDSMDICWVEYSKEDKELRIVVYADGNAEDYTHLIKIRNTSKSDMVKE